MKSTAEYCSDNYLPGGWWFNGDVDTPRRQAPASSRHQYVRWANMPTVDLRMLDGQLSINDSYNSHNRAIQYELLQRQPLHVITKVEIEASL